MDSGLFLKKYLEREEGTFLTPALMELNFHRHPSPMQSERFIYQLPIELNMYIDTKCLRIIIRLLGENGKKNHFIFFELLPFANFDIENLISKKTVTARSSVPYFRGD